MIEPPYINYASLQVFMCHSAMGFLASASLLALDEEADAALDKEDDGTVEEAENDDAFPNAEAAAAPPNLEAGDAVTDAEGPPKSRRTQS